MVQNGQGKTFFCCLSNLNMSRMTYECVLICNLCVGIGVFHLISPPPPVNDRGWGCIYSITSIIIIYRGFVPS
jgi:hypothetical protein